MTLGSEQLQTENKFCPVCVNKNMEQQGIVDVREQRKKKEELCTAF